VLFETVHRGCSAQVDGTGTGGAQSEPLRFRGVSCEDDVDQQDVERIARATLKELGVFGVVLTIAADGPPGHWRIDIQGGHGPGHLKIRCGQGSSAQWVRDQIFEQYLAQS
jgi:hypothetical protein